MFAAETLPPLIALPRPGHRATPPVSTSKKPTPSIRSTADFARYVGLARTTVSRVLNDQPGLRAKTVERVRRAMEETGFTPNAHALHLRGKRTAMIGVCMENLLTPPAVAKLALLQQMLRARNYTTLIEVLEPGRSRQVVQYLLSLRVDGVVFIGHFVAEEIEQRIEELRRHATPHVVVDHVGLKGAHTVSLDRAESMTQAMDHLWRSGHRRFGFLGFSGPHRSTQDRLHSAGAFLRQHGLDLAGATRSLDHLHPRANDFEYGRALAGSFATHVGRPTAFLALNDEIAIGAMHGFQAASLRVPRDLSIVGFNNQNICLMPTPSLTSVDQQIDRTITAAVDAIFTQIDRPTVTKTIMHWISPVLVVRESTGPVSTA
jgi:DNA-binding LacI/PurR family transcriptional regulator